MCLSDHLPTFSLIQSLPIYIHLAINPSTHLSTIHHPSTHPLPIYLTAYPLDHLSIQPPTCSPHAATSLLIYFRALMKGHGETKMPFAPADEGDAA